jgi:ABC-2 type transport system permease protein
MIPSDTIEPPPPAQEWTPSATQVEVPQFSRFVGMVGLFLLTIGTASIIAADYGRGPLGASYGYIAGVFGLAGLLIHALRDSDLEIRRLYGAFGTFLVFVAIIVGFLPGGEARALGYYFLPWGISAGFIGLLFLVPFLKHETEEPIKSFAEFFVLGIGALLLIASLAFGLFKPDFLVGPGLLLSLLGTAYVSAYLSNVDTSTGRGYQVAVALGVLGAVALAVALGRSIAPSVLYDGPSALRNAAQSTDKWKLAARLVSILLSGGVAALVLVKALPLWFRSVSFVTGLALIGVFITGSVTKAIVLPPEPFLIPHGLILAGIGVLNLLLSAGILTDNQFIVLTRRELSSYFFSPIAYLVLFGVVMVLGIGYIWFVITVSAGRGNGPPQPIPEPILQFYSGFNIVSAFLVVFIVPALTMRLFSEEQRSGTLEVLLTAQVSDATVVLSKFTACWIYFMICWLPGGLYLIGIRIDGGVPFDYRPLLSYYLCLGCCAAALVSIGLFFSSLTRNQIVCAVLTGSTMFAIILTVVFTRSESLPEGLRAVLSKFDLLSLWGTALSGQLPVQAVVFQLSLAAFFLFLTTKVLEVRKWS